MAPKQDPKDIDRSPTSAPNQWLDQCEDQQIVPRGTKLITSGVAPDHLVILHAGSVEICVPATGKMETITVGTSCNSAAFGMQALVSGELPEATVTCLQECCVCFMPKKTFLERLSQDPSLSPNIIEVSGAAFGLPDKPDRPEDGC